VTRHAGVWTQTAGMGGSEPQRRMLATLYYACLMILGHGLQSSHSRTLKAVWNLVSRCQSHRQRERTHLAQRAHDGKSLLHFRFPFLQFQQTWEAIAGLSAMSKQAKETGRGYGVG
jgi:hypothetical protein